ncbi:MULTISPECIES: hypothetical protein [Burkholderia]|uniref:Uncharacterized protein n=1 Tax=Burkholderia anthina TaxID=179879 RepID=A0A7T7AJN8_9BURK|nr:MULTISPECIES: hypothetical protein [Burkholderia]QQK04877.1 hypothetical protein JFN94_26525 [Burkholderia anthina]
MTRFGAPGINGAARIRQTSHGIARRANAYGLPLGLLLGKVALTNANRKLDALRHDFDGWADVPRGADYPDA